MLRAAKTSVQHDKEEIKEEAVEEPTDGKTLVETPTEENQEEK